VPVSDVPVELEFRKSSYSAGGACVEVGQSPGGGSVVAVRNSRIQDGPHLTFTTAEWEAFVLGVKDGEFDIPMPRREIG
jgi:Domain of unknown function (DUF397)